MTIENNIKIENKPISTYDEEIIYFKSLIDAIDCIYLTNFSGTITETLFKRQKKKIIKNI